MLDPIEFGIDRKNALAIAAGNNDRVARMGYNMLGPDLMAKKFTLTHWILKGAPETWRAQLEDYYQNEPVFALLGGISAGDWAPVHHFCEDKHLPNCFRWLIIRCSPIPTGTLSTSRVESARREKRLRVT